MNKAKRTALLYQVKLAALAQGIEKPFGFKNVSASRLRRMVGAQFLTPRTHSNKNRDRQRRRRKHLARMLKHAAQSTRLESALSS